MRSSLVLLVGALLLAVPAAASDEEVAPETAFSGDPAAAAPAVAAMPSALEPPASDAAAAPEAAPAALAAAPAPGGDSDASAAPELAAVAPQPDTAAMPAAGGAPPLGRIGYDAEGRPGWVHVVIPRDTLWDISDAYLGTPWIWPSIWKDNREIENPHLIHPGEHIWITRTEMRRISREEAERRIANEPPAPAAPDAGRGEGERQPLKLIVDEPAGAAKSRVARVSSREVVGLITAEQFESAGSIVDAIPDRVMLSQNDRVYIGLGAGQVAVGDQFTIFRAREKVHDPDSGELLGYHVDILGWLEVEKIHPDTAIAQIHLSVAEIERGDLLVPREPLPLEIPILASPDDVQGRVSFFAHSRTIMGELDFVYLNRGATDGLEVGSPLEVYRAGYETEDRAHGSPVHVPDRVIAGLLVVRAQPETAVAFVTYSDEELELGDQFRGAAD